MNPSKRVHGVLWVLALLLGAYISWQGFHVSQDWYLLDRLMWQAGIRMRRRIAGMSRLTSQTQRDLMQHMHGVLSVNTGGKLSMLRKRSAYNPSC